MELRERLAGQVHGGRDRRPGDDAGHVRRAQGPHPHGGHLRTRAAALQRSRSPRATLREVVLADVRNRLTQERGLATADRERLVQEIANDTLGHGPIEPLLQDDTVTEVMVNGPADVWVERAGKLEKTRRAVHRRAPPAPDHQQDRRAGRAARRRVLADGRRAPARTAAASTRCCRRCRSPGRC